MLVAAVLFFFVLSRQIGAPIRMAGYNVTSRTGTNAEEIDRLLAGPKVARHIGELLRFYRGRQQAF